MRGSSFHNPTDLLSRQTPIDRVRDHTQPRAGSIQLKVGGMILRQDAEALALTQGQRCQPGSQSIDTLKKCAKSQASLGVDSGRALTVYGGIPYQHIVQRKLVHQHVASSGLLVPCPYPIPIDAGRLLKEVETARHKDLTGPITGRSLAEQQSGLSKITPPIGQQALQEIFLSLYHAIPLVP